jgi:hypothetical protein
MQKGPYKGQASIQQMPGQISTVRKQHLNATCNKQNGERVTSFEFQYIKARILCYSWYESGEAYMYIMIWIMIPWSHFQTYGMFCITATNKWWQKKCATNIIISLWS